MRTPYFLLLPLPLALACGGDTNATATFEAKSGSAIVGSIKFIGKNDLVGMFVAVENVTPPGNHGMHVHETGDCSAPDAMTAGPHWNPEMHAHGHIDREGHMGDLGNITIDAAGKGSLNFTTNKWTLEEGAANSLPGKAVILHGMPDDGSQPAGNAGPRIGCAVITLE